MMVRPCLVLAVLAAIVAPARAEPCNPDFISVNGVDVGQRGELRWQEHPSVAPLSDRRVEDRTDRTAPDAPRDVTVQLSSDFNADEEHFTLTGTFAPDTAFITVAITQGETTNYFVTTPDRLTVCSQFVRLTPERTQVSVVAYDLAFNDSRPFETETIVAGATYQRHHVRCGMGSMALIFIVPFVLLISLVIALTISMLRNSRIRKMPGEHVSIPLGESVARVVAKTYLIKSVVGVVGTMALLEFDYTITAMFTGLCALVWIVGLMRAGWLVSRFEKPVNRLERREDWLMVDHTLLYCGRRAWNRANRVPMASVTPK